VEDINETLNKIIKGIKEAAGKIIEKEDNREIVGLMKNVKLYWKIKRQLTSK
jgi:hypothetical protein